MDGRILLPVLTILAAVTLPIAGTRPASFAGTTAPPLVADSAEGEVFGRLYERGPDGQLSVRGLPVGDERTSPAVPLSPVTEQDIARRLAAADAGRVADLAGAAPAPPASRLVPEDLTRRARVFHVAVENYTDAALVQLLARVGRLEGFSVVARLAAGSAWTDELRAVPNVTAIELPGVQYVWTEDVVEIAVDGTFRMTARMGDRGLLIRRSLFVDRLRRYYPDLAPEEIERINVLPPGPASRPGILPDAIMRRFPEIMYMNQGLVEADGAQAVAAAIAAARGAPMREHMLYLEGGNVLLGTLRTGGPYALVGRDSVAIARAGLAHHHGRPITEAELRAAMARDLAVDPAHLVLVEQPGVFHLDMAMTLMRPGTVLLNDAVEALSIQTQWLREDYEAWRPRRDATASEEEYRERLARWQEAGVDLEAIIQRIAKYAERFARFEARTLADLQAAGLTVLRMPGRFLHPTRPWDRDVMNFLNGEAGVDARGGTYFITQGGDARAERALAARLLTPAVGLDRVYFAPRLASRDSLWEKGGIGCRVKAEGEVRP